MVAQREINPGGAAHCAQYLVYYMMLTDVGRNELLLYISDIDKHVYFLYACVIENTSM